MPDERHNEKACDIHLSDPTAWGTGRGHSGPVQFEIAALGLAIRDDWNGIRGDGGPFRCACRRNVVVMKALRVHIGNRIAGGFPGREVNCPMRDKLVH